MTRWDFSFDDAQGELGTSGEVATGAAVLRRIADLGVESRDGELLQCLKLFQDRRTSLECLNNRLMDSFRRTRSLEAYSLIYEINYKHFLQLIFKRTRFYTHSLDPKDIAQDVFLSIYRLSLIHI